MTLRPHPDHSRFVADPDTRDLGVQCMVPRCTRMATERHHIWSRRQLGRPADVVRDLETDQRRPNIAALCTEHHKDISGRLGGHRAQIVLDVTVDLYFWMDGNRLRPLDPQPELPREVEV